MPSLRCWAAAYHWQTTLLGVLPYFSGDWHVECMALLPLSTCSALLIVWGTLLGFWVIWQMKSLYYDRKKELVSSAVRLKPTTGAIRHINPGLLTECIVRLGHLTEVQAGCRIVALPDSCHLLERAAQ